MWGFGEFAGEDVGADDGGAGSLEDDVRPCSFDSFFHSFFLCYGKIERDREEEEEGEIGSVNMILTTPDIGLGQYAASPSNTTFPSTHVSIFTCATCCT